MSTANNVHSLPPKRSRRPRVPSVPKHLQTVEARKLWRSTVAEFQLEQHHLIVLDAACTCVDRLVEARAAVDRDGITVTDRFGQLREHPATKIERDCRIALARLLRELQLADEGLDVRLPRSV